MVVGGSRRHHGRRPSVDGRSVVDVPHEIATSAQIGGKIVFQVPVESGLPVATMYEDDCRCGAGCFRNPPLAERVGGPSSVPIMLRAVLQTRSFVIPQPTVSAATATPPCAISRRRSITANRLLPHARKPFDET